MVISSSVLSCTPEMKGLPAGLLMLMASATIDSWWGTQAAGHFVPYDCMTMKLLLSITQALERHRAAAPAAPDPPHSIWGCHAGHVQACWPQLPQQGEHPAPVHTHLELQCWQEEEEQMVVQHNQNLCLWAWSAIVVLTWPLGPLPRLRIRRSGSVRCWSTSRSCLLNWPRFFRPGVKTSVSAHIKTSCRTERLHRSSASLPLFEIC